MGPGQSRKRVNPYRFVDQPKFDFLSNPDIEPSRKTLQLVESHFPPNVEFFKDPSTTYTKIELIGKGSYGEVFTIRRKSDSAVVACKIISMTNEEKSTVKSILKEVSKEIEILQELGSNDHIIELLEAYYFRTKFWIVLEYCEAGSLQDYLDFCLEDGPGPGMNEEQICAIIRQVLRGLSFLHTHNKIHRDVKSGNILLSADGRIVLADFGVSTDLRDETKRRRSLQGSPFWLAPEVLMYSQYDEKADIWSLGITIIELAQKFPPHFGRREYEVYNLIQERPSPTFLNPADWSENCNDFLAQCLVKDSKRRPTAARLLRHPFLGQVGSREERDCLEGIVGLLDEAYEAGGGREKLLRDRLAGKSVGKKRVVEPHNGEGDPVVHMADSSEETSSSSDDSSSDSEL